MSIRQIIDKGAVDELYKEGHIYSKFGEYIRKAHIPIVSWLAE